MTARVLRPLVRRSDPPQVEAERRASPTIDTGSLVVERNSCNRYCRPADLVTDRIGIEKTQGW